MTIKLMKNIKIHHQIHHKFMKNIKIQHQINKNIKIQHQIYEKHQNSLLKSQKTSKFKTNS
jgi:hypothetical protein